MADTRSGEHRVKDTAQGQLALEWLLTRRSEPLLREPAPNDGELDLILRAAMCAPDHRSLRPWRIALVRGDARSVLAQLCLDAANQEFPGMLSAEQQDDAKRALQSTPLIIAIAAEIREGRDVPEQEQLLAVGAATMNMLNAAHCLGYGAVWLTGAVPNLVGVRRTFGWDGPQFRVLGYLAVGTPARAVGVPRRPDYRKYVVDWRGPPASSG